MNNLAQNNFIHPDCQGQFAKSMCECFCHSPLAKGNPLYIGCWCKCKKLTSISIPTDPLIKKEIELLKSDNESICRSISSNDALIKHSQEGLEKLFNRIEKIEYILGDVYEKNQRISIKKGNKKPHICPLCEGMGYINDCAENCDICPPCKGKGVLWK